MKGFMAFKKHVEEDRPMGVKKIPQYTGAKTKIDEFQKRYPLGRVTSKAGDISIAEIYLAEESAFAIQTQAYLDWLLAEAQKKMSITLKTASVLNVQNMGNRIELQTNHGETYSGDHILFCGGVYQNFWAPLFQEERISKSKCVQGSYLEFTETNLGDKSFSMTLEGNNLIYHADEKILLIGSTTQEVRHHLAPMEKLRGIYDKISRDVKLELPGFKQGIVKTGLRDKAPKRLPYVMSNPAISAMGGFYKNGFTLSLVISQSWLSQISETP